METHSENPRADTPRWSLLRDLGMLQGKLVIDGFRDLLLLPASIIAAIVSFAKGTNGVPGPQFYNLLLLGKQSEHWINLFGAVRNAPKDAREPRPFGDVDIDDIVARVENFVVDEYRRGGVTAQAKSRIDAALRSLRRRNRKSADSAPH